MKTVKLFPPKGGDPVKAHPSQVKYMKSRGWIESPINDVKQTKEVSKNG